MLPGIDLLASDRDNKYMMMDAAIVRAHQQSVREKKANKRSPGPAAD